MRLFFLIEMNVLTQPDNIWVRLVKTKYLKNNSIDFLRVKKLIRHPMLGRAF